MGDFRRIGRASFTPCSRGDAETRSAQRHRSGTRGPAPRLCIPTASLHPSGRRARAGTAWTRKRTNWVKEADHISLRRRWTFTAATRPSAALRQIRGCPRPCSCGFETEASPLLNASAIAASRESPDHWTDCVESLRFTTIQIAPSTSVGETHSCGLRTFRHGNRGTSCTPAECSC